MQTLGSLYGLSVFDLLGVPIAKGIAISTFKKRTGTICFDMAIENFGDILKGVMWSQVVLAATFIGMRLYTRHFILKNLGADDLLMIVNLLSRILIRPLSISSTNRTYSYFPEHIRRLRGLYHRRRLLWYW
jgi:hypothetical protein